MINACETILNHSIWTNEIKMVFNFHNLNLHMPYMRQCVIGATIIVNNGQLIKYMFESIFHP